MTTFLSEEPLARWHAAMTRRDGAALDALVAEEAVFQSPAVHRAQQGKALVLKYLRAAMQVLGSEHFRYVGEWRDERSAVLEFETRLGEVEVDGVDIIHWNADGLIVNFKVMVRPMKALNAVLAPMAERLAADA